MHASQGGAGRSNRWRRGEGRSGAAPAHFPLHNPMLLPAPADLFFPGEIRTSSSFSLSYFSRAADGSFCASGRGKGEGGIEEQRKRKVGGSERLSVYYIGCTKTTMDT